MATLTVPAPAGGTTDDQTTLANVWAAAASGDTINFPTNATYRKSGKLTLSGKNVVINGNGSTINSTNPSSCAISWTNGAVANCNNLKHIILGASTRINLANDVAGFVVNASSIGDLRDLLSRGSAGLGYYFWNAQGAGKSVTNVQRIISDTTLADGIHFTNGTGGFTATDCQSLDAGDDGFAHIGYLQDGAEAGRPHDIDLVRPYVKDSRARAISYAGAKDCNSYDPNVDGSLAASVYFAVERGDFNTGQTSNCHVYRGRLARCGTSYAAIPNGTNGVGLDQGNVLFLGSGADAIVSNCSIEDTNVGNSTQPPSYDVVRAIVYNGGTLTNDSAQRINCYSGAPTSFVGGNTVASISPATSNNYRTTALPAYSSTGTVAAERSDAYSVAALSGGASAALSDSFNRVNASSAGTADTGQVWGTNVGTWGTDGATLGSVSKADGNQISIDAGTKVQDVEAKLVAGIATNSYPALLINWEGTGTYYRVEMEPNGAAGINRGINSSFTNFTPKAPAGTVKNGSVIRLKSEIGATSTILTLYVDGVQVAAVNDSWNATGRPAPTGTRVGFRHGAGAGGISILWDDLTVNKVSKTPVVALRSEAYAVKNTVVDAESPTWAVRSAVAASISDTFAVRAAVASSRADTYAVKSTVATPRADTYGVRTAAVSSGSDTYAVRLSMLTSTGTDWSVSAPGVVSSRADTYGVRTATGSTDADAYGVRTTVSMSSADSYGVRSSVSSTAADAYPVRSTAVVTAADSYGVRSTAAVTIVDAYAVRSTVLSSRFDAYGVRSTAPSSRSDTYGVRAGLAAQNVDAYAIRARVTEMRSDTTVVRGTVAAERFDIYGVVSIANLEVQIGDAYAVRSIVSVGVADDYGVRAALAPVSVFDRYSAKKFVALSRINTSPVRALVESSRADTFAVVGTVVVEVSDTFVTTGAVRVSVDDAWSVRAPLAIARADAYRVASAVQTARSDAYAARVPVAAQTVDAYRVASAVQTARSDAYAVRVTVALSRSDAYVVRTSLAVTRADSYRLAGSGIESIADDAWSVAGAVRVERFDRWSIVGAAGASRTDSYRAFRSVGPVSRSDAFTVTRDRLSVRVRAGIAVRRVRATLSEIKIGTG